MTEESIFAAAVDLADPAEREAYLAGACGADAALRGRVDGLLAAHAAAGTFLERPAAPAPDANATWTADGPPPDDSLSFLAPPGRPDSLGRLGHYEVLEVLGRGGFGIVFRAFDEVLQRVVAVKVLAPQMAATSPARKRFLREARSSAQVRHENVVAVHAVEEQPLPYLVMEFIPGETLQQRLDRTGPLDVPEILRIGRQIAEGLAAAHGTGLIHRDVKPANVLIEAGPRGRVKLTDFGLARAADDASISQSGVVAGTPMYMAPEQARGDALDHRADLFSLGSVLYVLCTGRPPFRASGTLAVLKRVCEEAPRPIREVIPEVPEWLCRVVEKLHAKDPGGRFQTAREAADVLADCERQVKESGAVRDFGRIPGGRPRPRGRVVRWVAVAAALAAAGAALTWWRGWANDLSAPRPPAGGGAAVAAPEPGPAPADGFVPLFNGRDLAGWKTHPDQPGSWKVENGALVGRGPAASHLFTERGDLRDVHLRVEARLNATGDSGVFVRCPFGLPFGFGGAGLPGGFNADFQWDGSAVAAGRLFRLGPKSALAPVTVPADTWFTLEVVATGDRVVVRVNGQTTADYTDPDRTVTAGHVALQVFKPGTVVEFRKVEVKELPPSPPPSADGFVPLFNGKDLTGWKTHPDQPGSWKVEDGVLLAAGAPGDLPSRVSDLFTDRGDYRDFHLRVEARADAAADSGVFLRVPFRPLWGSHPYEVQICGRAEKVYNTGSLWGVPEGKVLVPPVPPDEWFTLEVIARGSRLVVKVNGNTTADWTDPKSRYSAGHLALQHFLPDGVVRFRKVEVKELPPEPPAGTGFTPLFNGKDLAGWKAHPDAPGEWAVEDGLLLGRGKLGYLFSQRRFQDFHLRADARVGAAGDAGVWFRSPFGVTRWRSQPDLPLIDGYEAQVAGDGPHRTGDLGMRAGPAAWRLVEKSGRPAPGPDRWFTLEVIARGDRVEVKVDGATTAAYTDPKDTFRSGHVALQVFKPGTVVAFRKVEVKELPPGVAPEPAPATVDLLGLIDPDRDALQGTWKWDGKALDSPAPLAQLQVPFAPPAHYRLTLEVERTTPPGALNVGLIVAGRTACVTLDYNAAVKGGQRSGLAGLDGKLLRKNEAVYDGPVLGPGRNTVVAEVRGTRVTVRVGETRVIDWEGDPDRFTVSPNMGKTDGKRLYLGHLSAGYRFHRLELEPLPPPEGRPAVAPEPRPRP